MKIESVTNHSKIARQKYILYKSYRIIKLDEGEAKLFRKKIKYLLGDFKIDIIDNNLKVLYKSTKPNYYTRDNEVFNEHKELLERKVQKAHQILKDYKETKNT